MKLLLNFIDTACCSVNELLNSYEIKWQLDTLKWEYLQVQLMLSSILWNRTFQSIDYFQQIANKECYKSYSNIFDFREHCMSSLGKENSLTLFLQFSDASLLVVSHFLRNRKLKSILINSFKPIMMHCTGCYNDMTRFPIVFSQKILKKWKTLAIRLGKKL